MSKPQMSCWNCSYSMHGTRLHKTSRRDAMARDPRRDLLGRDRDVEGFVRDVSTSRDRDVSTETTSLQLDNQGVNVA